ncbi:energy transducer TonB [Xanthomonas translucens]|uniref:Energy transducer TonB n=4 Tax=Xanthomonas campestris pv. translucens TaxID=343 RepID=A0A120EX08_XANCT|nr:energy transducer TonB [Xanthomonas translucens]KTF40652.1 energy transducer TonB [Xanthomonas translucens pv. translucens]KWV13715.1 energy transducer TonB [Xanthomonas translucens]MCC8448378.1 TonB family protein [Xanthomonas translucens pv. translucens]MCS3359056.1 TonB family protein [Xanthomonas translucens pv. translucens]MCS3372393.1 TonB family protein [Xanthomonas translucens pv. translucens]
MVRTQLPAPSFAIDLSRILALSAAIGLHLLAMLLLLIPLSHVAPPQAPAKAQPVWQQPIVVPITPPPHPTVQPQKRPMTQPRVPIAAPVPAPVQAVLADASPRPVQDAIADPAAVTAEPSVPPTPVSAPVAGMQLQYLRAPAPPYPRDALRDGLQGSVLLRVLVGVDGQPLEVSIARSSGHRILDQAAREQVLKRWKFHAALQQGMPVQAYGLVPVNFSLGR